MVTKQGASCHVFLKRILFILCAPIYWIWLHVWYFPYWIRSMVLSMVLWYFSWYWFLESHCYSQSWFSQMFLFGFWETTRGLGFQSCFNFVPYSCCSIDLHNALSCVQKSEACTESHTCIMHTPKSIQTNKQTDK